MNKPTDTYGIFLPKASFFGITQVHTSDQVQYKQDYQEYIQNILEYISSRLASGAGNFINPLFNLVTLQVLIKKVKSSEGYKYQTNM